MLRYGSDFVETGNYICDLTEESNLYFQVENINTCLTFLVNLGVNIDGITAKGKYACGMFVAKKNLVPLIDGSLHQGSSKVFSVWVTQLEAPILHMFCTPDSRGNKH